MVKMIGPMGAVMRVGHPSRSIIFEHVKVVVGMQKQMLSELYLEAAQTSSLVGKGCGRSVEAVSNR